MRCFSKSGRSAVAGGGTRFSGKRRVHRASSPSERAARALGRGETRELQPRPFLDRVMDEQKAPELERRVRLGPDERAQMAGDQVNAIAPPPLSIIGTFIAQLRE